MAAAMLSFREAVLACATGVGGGAAGTYVVLRSVWEGAQQMGKTADQGIVGLRLLHGVSDDVPSLKVCQHGQRIFPNPIRFVAPSECDPALTQRMEVPSLLDLRLRRDLSNAWNASVVSFYDSARKWL